MKVFLNVSSKTARLLAESIRKTTQENEFVLKSTALSFMGHLESIGTKADNIFHQFEDIDYLKDVVVELRAYSDESGSEYCNSVSDIMFKIETDYQAWHGLSEENFCKVA